MINAVIFDLDQTLLDRTATFKLFLGNQHARFEQELTSVPTADFISMIMRYDKNGYAPKEEVYAQVCTEFDLTIQDKLLADFLENYGQEPVLFDDAIGVLETLSKSYPLGLITNGRVKGQSAKIDQSGIRHFFKAIKISEGEGVKKPSPIIFERCLAKMGVAAGQAVYIGDHPEKDVAAAQKVGLKGIWRANPHYQTPDYADGMINNLNELIDLLPKL
ncbi:MAG: HAD family hydrolase [Anaerolineae bacterium]